MSFYREKLKRPSSVYRVASGYEPPGLPAVAQNPPGIRASRDSWTWTGLSTLPRPA